MCGANCNMNAVIDRFGLLLDIIDEMRNDLNAANEKIADQYDIIADFQSDLKRANDASEKERAITDAVTDSYSLLESENQRFRHALERIASLVDDGIIANPDDYVSRFQIIDMARDALDGNDD